MVKSNPTCTAAKEISQGGSALLFELHSGQPLGHVVGKGRKPCQPRDQEHAPNMGVTPASRLSTGWRRPRFPSSLNSLAILEGSGGVTPLKLTPHQRRIDHLHERIQKNLARHPENPGSSCNSALTMLSDRSLPTFVASSCQTV
jgi:hypothetical protein